MGCGDPRGDGPETSDLWRGAETYACKGGPEAPVKQRTLFRTGAMLTPMLLPSPCEARKTGGTAGAVCDEARETLTIAGCRRSCPGTQNAVRVWVRISPRWERNPRCGTGARPAASGASTTPGRRPLQASRRGRPSGRYLWPPHEGTILWWPSQKSKGEGRGRGGGGEGVVYGGGGGG